ncbi:MAG: hypothetical protein DMG06_06035 [Acidobacteria bacterium]|nr:MAG: hypothetical protein DMG06_06035 [Acidobacteriota bacterium]
MQIGIDARSLGLMQTGVGTYLSEILKHHPFSSGSARNHLFCHRPPAFPPADNITLHISKATRGLPWYLFRAHQVINDCSLNIFWGTQNLLPRNLSKSLPAVITIHDCVHQAGWGFSPSMAYNLVHRYYIPKAIRRSSKILTVSNFVADEIQRYYGVSHGKLEVTPLGVSSHFSAQNIKTNEIPTILDRYQIHMPFILGVGTLEPRKNLKTLLQAFALLPVNLRRKFQLVLAGKSGWRSKELSRSLKGLPPDCRVVLPGYIAHEHLPGIYAAAEIFVFPSCYEGFGLPVLEAMAAGCPVIASSSSSLKELVSTAGISLDPCSPAEEWSNSICKVALSSELRNELKAKGLLRAQQYRWEKCAETTFEVLRGVAS